jgi:hypothetical protein
MGQWLSAAAVLFFASLVTPASAGIIFTNSVSESGTGFGSVLTLLTVQESPSEYGSILWDGIANVLSGDAKQSSQTHAVDLPSADDLVGNGITPLNFGIVFNIAEPGNDPGIVLNDYELVFMDGAGNELFTESYLAPPGGLPLAAQGQGIGNSGWVFEFAPSPQLASFFSAPSNRVGMRILQGEAITDSAGSPETFYLAALNEPIPEPATVVLLSLAVVLGLTVRACRDSSAATAGRGNVADRLPMTTPSINGR